MRDGPQVPGESPGGASPSEEDRRAILAHLRHELRTPLNAVIGYSEMLLEDGADSRIEPGIKQVHETGRRVLGLVNSILDPARLESGGVPDLNVFLGILQSQLDGPVTSLIETSAQVLGLAEGGGDESIVTELQRIDTAARALYALLSIPGSATDVALAGAPDGASSPEPAPSLRPVSDGRLQISELARDASSSLRGLRGEFEGDQDQGGHILVVDDNDNNRILLVRRLERQGFQVAQAENGRVALDMISHEAFDLVLLDIMMPVMNGYEVLEQLKLDGTLFQLPVIMISALEEIGSVVRCIEMGAEDYLPKPFNPVLLQARIGASLEKKRLRDREHRTFQALVNSQKQLATELAEAASYVRSLLPAPISGPVSADWIYIPSTRLGGDSFGYHWLDTDHFAVYLLDVCGHGVGAALLSVSAMNVLRSQALPNTDFRDPSSVLSALNDAFQMDQQNNMYFTIWYGVFQKTTSELVYASGGHPPALLLEPGAGPIEPQELRTRSPLIGGLPGIPYSSASCPITPGSRLLVFSDGAYEIHRPDGSMLTFEEFSSHLRELAGQGKQCLAGLLSFAREVRGSDLFEDDFSLVEVAFG